jgi:FlaG/FlaF family flagellin (archaellin)
LFDGAVGLYQNKGDDMRKTTHSKQAVSEVIGVVLMLGIAIALFALLNFSVFSFSFDAPAPSVNLIGTIDRAHNVIAIDHNGGTSLERDIKVIIEIGSDVYENTIDDLLTGVDTRWELTDVNNDSKWNFGETVRFESPVPIPDKYIRVTVVNTAANTILLSVNLQHGSS